MHHRYAYHCFDILLVYSSLWSYLWSHLSKCMYIRDVY